MISGILSKFAKPSIILSDTLSSIKHKIPVGIVLSTMYQNILPSVDFSFFTSCLYPPLISFTQSLKKNTSIANKVPICSATSKAGFISPQLNNQGNKFK